jgi:hypothetical protein
MVIASILFLILIVGTFTVNLTGYYELDQETKVIRSFLFLIAVILSVILGMII